ncbi:MAG TPA: AAA family ATPase [Ignavibacteriales bacterium]|nr:AAA family ATPase [Ignavibacteriales bacterium]
MKLKSFRIENFRCIHDSGWIDADNITALVGKNESGKTAILRALHKFNPYKNEEYSLDREWPRGKRKERSGDKIAARVRFVFTESEFRELSEIDPNLKNIEYVEISKNYAGRYSFSFFPAIADEAFDLKAGVVKIKEKIGTPPKGSSANLQSEYLKEFNSLIKEIIDGDDKNLAVVKLSEFKDHFVNSANFSKEKANTKEEIERNVDSSIAELNNGYSGGKAIEKIKRWMPVFIYMDDFKIFSGSAHLDQVLRRKETNSLTYEDETIITILEMSGLNLEQEVEKAGRDNREQRVLDMSDASQTLTDEIATRWSQKKYEVVFQADGYHFITFVRDDASQVLVPLEERSKGFQWFFSFDMTFMHETRGKFSNAVILLDEPGLHLHSVAKRDLLKRLHAYSKDNQIIYSTHEPFMLDIEKLDSVYIVEEFGSEGSKAHKNWVSAGKEARFTLQAALGLSWHNSLFLGDNALFVAEVSDLWILEAVSAIFKEASLVGLDPKITIIPVGGAVNFAYVGNLLLNYQSNSLVLLNSDKYGETAYKQLVHSWNMKDDRIFLLGKIFETSETRYLEDLLDPNYYIGMAGKAYSKELRKKDIKIKDDSDRSIVDKIADELAQKGIMNYERNRAAHSIASDLTNKHIGDLQPITLNNFRKLFTMINEIALKWH